MEKEIFFYKKLEKKVKGFLELGSRYFSQR